MPLEPTTDRDTCFSGNRQRIPLAEDIRPAPHRRHGREPDPGVRRRRCRPARPVARRDLDPRTVRHPQRPARADPRRLAARHPSAGFQRLGDAAGVARHHLDPRRTPRLEPARRGTDDPGGRASLEARARAGRLQHRPASAHPVAAAGDGLVCHLPLLLLANRVDRHPRARRPPYRRDEGRSRSGARRSISPRSR